MARLVTMEAEEFRAVEKAATSPAELERALLDRIREKGGDPDLAEINFGRRRVRAPRRVDRCRD